MSEKRFVLCKKGDVEYIEDNCCVQLYGFDVLCEMLNEQQAEIDDLKEENEQLKRQNKVLKDSSLTDAYFDYLESSRTFTLKVVEEPIRVTKYEELEDE